MLFGSSSKICVILINLLFLFQVELISKPENEWFYIKSMLVVQKNHQFQSSRRPFSSSPNPTFPCSTCYYSIMDYYFFVIFFRHTLHTQTNILVPYLLIDVLHGRCTERFSFVYPIFYVKVSEKQLSPKNKNFFIC